MKGTLDEHTIASEALRGPARRSARAAALVYTPPSYLFDATHLAIEYRYPIGLRYLADRLR
jgi:hypothetical protein